MSGDRFDWSCLKVVSIHPQTGHEPFDLSSDRVFGIVSVTEDNILNFFELSLAQRSFFGDGFKVFHNDPPPESSLGL
jgi:hypothetical protein